MRIEEITAMVLVVKDLKDKGWEIDTELSPEGYIKASKDERKWLIKIMPVLS
jgi:hypothetical protein